jgi:hypothetical protein
MTEPVTERPLSYPPDAVLTLREACAWLDISATTFHRRGIKHADGMVLAKWVYENLELRAAS